MAAVRKRSRLLTAYLELLLNKLNTDLPSGNIALVPSEQVNEK